MKREGLPAVHDDDLLELLNNLGLIGPLERGEVRCRFCETTVTADSLGAIFPAHGSVWVVCSEADCLQKLLRDRDEARHG